MSLGWLILSPFHLLSGPLPHHTGLLKDGSPTYPSLPRTFLVLAPKSPAPREIPLSRTDQDSWCHTLQGPRHHKELREKGADHKASAPAHLASHPPPPGPGRAVERKANSNPCVATSASLWCQGNAAGSWTASGGRTKGGGRPPAREADRREQARELAKQGARVPQAKTQSHTGLHLSPEALWP